MSTARTQQRRASARSGKAGFTLVELMLALAAGSFVVAGAYYLSDASARLFNEQIRRSETQMTLRTAGEQLRRDIGRAGFMAVRDSHELWNCSSALVASGGTDITGVRQRGVQVRRLADQRVQLFLTGNFTTSDQYPLNPTSTSDTLVLANGREGFRRSFVNPVTGLFMPQRFLSAFAPNPAAPNTPQGRMVSIQDLSTGRIFLRNIVSVNPVPDTAPQIVITPALPTTGGCIPSFSTLVVAPISTVRYMLEDPTANPELARAAGASLLAGGQNMVGNARRFVLTRTEIDMTTNATATPTPIPQTTRIILDFVSSANAFSAFRIEGFFDRNFVIGGATLPPNLVWTATPDTVAEPASLRSLLVELAASTAEATTGTAPNNNERAFRILGGRRLLRSEVAMPNMSRNPGTL